jgi:hypothetical protein
MLINLGQVRHFCSAQCVVEAGDVLTAELCDDEDDLEREERRAPEARSPRDGSPVFVRYPWE